LISRKIKVQYLFKKKNILKVKVTLNGNKLQQIKKQLIISFLFQPLNRKKVLFSIGMKWRYVRNLNRNSDNKPEQLNFCFHFKLISKGFKTMIILGKFWLTFCPLILSNVLLSVSKLSLTSFCADVSCDSRSVTRDPSPASSVWTWNEEITTKLNFKELGLEKLFRTIQTIK